VRLNSPLLQDSPRELPLDFLFEQVQPRTIQRRDKNGIVPRDGARQGWELGFIQGHRERLRKTRVRLEDQQTGRNFSDREWHRRQQRFPLAPIDTIDFFHAKFLQMTGERGERDLKALLTETREQITLIHNFPAIEVAENGFIKAHQDSDPGFARLRAAQACPHDLLAAPAASKNMHSFAIFLQIIFSNTDN